MKEKKDKTETEKLVKAINRFVERNKRNVLFYGTFVVFDEKGDIVDDRMFCYGDKDIIKTSLEGFTEQLDEEKDDFINW
ncbi:MAG: hypothetical protein KAW92_09660 [Candidatus Cloacimonetes bacterium]|nr:hypothetical protein [Candidatus Cloacimonadota bacterium]